MVVPPEQFAADADAEILPGASVPGLAGLVARMSTMKASLDDLEAQQTALKREYDDVRKRQVPAALAAAGLTAAKFLSGTLSLRSKTYAHVAKGKRRECIDWLRLTGNEEVLTVQPTALLALVNELIADGWPVPEFIQMYVEEIAVLTPPKGAKSE